jgi:hypothetical protein
MLTILNVFFVLFSIGHLVLYALWLEEPTIGIIIGGITVRLHWRDDV